MAKVEADMKKFLNGIYIFKYIFFALETHETKDWNSKRSHCIN